ncbi:MAG: hypothetical protein AAFQ89_16215 [Cyanobacteria bacterium J06626_18]
MTLPPDDDRLVEFLRRHRPEPPNPSPDLEDQLMVTVEAEGSSRKRVGHSRCDRPTRRPYRWTIPAIAASALLAWGGWLNWRPPSQEAELAAVDDFLTETWYGSAFGDDSYGLDSDMTDPGWFLSVYAMPY